MCWFITGVCGKFFLQGMINMQNPRSLGVSNSSITVAVLLKKMLLRVGEETRLKK